MLRSFPALFAIMLAFGVGCAETTALPVPPSVTGMTLWVTSSWESSQPDIWRQQSFDEFWRAEGPVQLLEMQDGQPALPYEIERSLRLVPGGVPLPILRTWHPVESPEGDVSWKLDESFDRDRNGLLTSDAATCVRLGGCVVKDDDDISVCRRDCDIQVVVDPPAEPNADCLEGWVSTGPVDAPLCFPAGYEAHTFVDCGPGAVDWGRRLSDTPGVCTPLSDCPNPLYVAPPPGAVFVDAAARENGDGSRARPYPSIDVAAENGGRAILLAPGQHEMLAATSVRHSLELIGSCASETTVSVDQTAAITGTRLALSGVSFVAPDGLHAIGIASGQLHVQNASVLGPIIQTGGRVDILHSSVHAVGLDASDRAVDRQGGTFTASASAFLGRLFVEGGEDGEDKDFVLRHVLVRGSRTTSPNAPGRGIEIRNGARADLSHVDVHWFFNGGITVDGGRLDLRDSLIWTTAGTGVEFLSSNRAFSWSPSIVERVVTLRAAVAVSSEPAGLFVIGDGVLDVRHFGTDAFYTGVKIDNFSTVSIAQSWIGFGGNRGLNISPGARWVEASDLIVSSTYDGMGEARSIDDYFGVRAGAGSNMLRRIKIRPGFRHGLQLASGASDVQDVQIVGPHSIALLAESGGSVVERISTKVPGRGPSFDVLSLTGTTEVAHAHFRVVKDPTVALAQATYEIRDFLWEGCLEENSLDVQTLRLRRGTIVLEPGCRIRSDIFQLMDQVRVSFKRP